MDSLVFWLLRLLVPLALAGTAAALVLLLRRGDERWEKMTASAALTTLVILAAALALMTVRNAVEGAAGLAPWRLDPWWLLAGASGTFLLSLLYWWRRYGG